MKQPQETPSKGFVIVATKRTQFLMGAQNLAESILDHYEDARITLFTEQQFLDDPDTQKYLTSYENVLPTPLPGIPVYLNFLLGFISLSASPTLHDSKKGFFSSSGLLSAVFS